VIEHKDGIFYGHSLVELGLLVDLNKLNIHIFSHKDVHLKRSVPHSMRKSRRRNIYYDRFIFIEGTYHFILLEK
jgi:hypothetical protein